ncbi:MAG: DUF1501 domain-containing protein [Candidatus Solibacter usitatus]|nr:DUF1501 domain-containing protein [Candidatus Solibacter usitatus]
MDPLTERRNALTRRHFFGCTSVGSAALASLLSGQTQDGVTGGFPNHAPRAKRVIYLFMSGGPSQMELFDYKPNLEKWRGTDLPDSVRMGQRLTAMTAAQTKFPVVQSLFQFKQHGQSGAWASNLVPHTAKIADRLCFIKSMNTEAINHDPAVTFFQTGFQLPGRPSIGSWLSYGLGSENKDLPAFVVMISSTGKGDQPLYDRLWSSGFLPSRYQGVKFRSAGEPVLYLSNPDGMSVDGRRRFLDDLAKMNQMQLEDYGDPEIATRIAQYEMAYRMQTSVPDLTELSKEPESTYELYGEDARKPGTFARNCLLARRMAERGVRFIQLFHRGWDHHTTLPENIRKVSKDTDQGAAALVTDLEQRGLLKDTLVVWGGEFGRTVYCQGKLTPEDYGRDHHPRCFTVWMAGGGVKAGFTYGATDDYSYNITENPVHVHDLHATILHTLGIDHLKLTYKFQGRYFRLTDIHGNVVKPLLA